MTAPTPRTDATIDAMGAEDIGWDRLADFARQLERELDALRKGLSEPITELTLDTISHGALMKSVKIQMQPGTYLVRRKPEGT